jgi:hypothetical protein
MVVEEEFRSLLRGPLGEHLAQLQSPPDLLARLRLRDAGRRRQARMRVGLAVSGVTVLVAGGAAVRVSSSRSPAVGPAVAPVVTPLVPSEVAPVVASTAPAVPVPSAAVGVPLVATGPCAGLRVVAYQPTGKDDHPAETPWQISPGDVTQFSYRGDDLLYFKATGPCVDQLVLEPETPSFQTATGPNVQYPFSPNLSEGDISALVTNSDSVDRTGLVGFALACPATGKVCAGTPLATVRITILATGASQKTGFPAPPTTGTRVAVPYLIGMTGAAAVDALRRAGFNGWGEEYSATTTGPAGVVTGQYPLAGSEILLNGGYSVSMSISGPGPVHPTGVGPSGTVSAVPSSG